MAQSELERRLGELRHGDHLCLVYDGPDDQMAAAVPFIAGGLSAGECCVYVADDRTPAEVAAALAAAGVDVAEEQRRGALRLLTGHDTDLDPAAMIDFLSRAVEQALAEGFAGFRV